MKGYRKWSARILGAVFFLAGTFKLMDPVGTSLIVTEYFKFLNLFPMIPLSWWAGFILSLCETVLGAALVTCTGGRLTACLSALFMAAFTALTLALLIVNPDMDCGCFGEAIHLTHTQSFIKNLVLDLLWVAAFIPMKGLAPPTADKRLAFGISMAGILLFGLYFAGSNPAADYTTMYPGAELFKPDNFLSEEDPVLSFCTPEGEYMDHLAYEGPVMAVSIYNPDKVRRKTWIKIRSLCLDSGRHGFRFLLLLPQIPEDLDRTLMLHAYTADRKTLMTLNRSNGGAAYIHSGMIVKKWESRRLPDFHLLMSIKEEDPTALMMEAETWPVIAVETYILSIFAIMLLI